MNDLAKNVIDDLAPSILHVAGFGEGVSGTRLWTDIKMFIRDAESTTLTHDEKKAKVKRDLVAVFGDTAEFVLNFAVEIGVIWLKAGII